MYYNLNNEILKRSTKTVYRDNNSIVKLFIENYSKADILNEALNLSRVEEGTDLNIPKLKEITKIDNRWGLITEYVEGDSLQELIDRNPEKIDEYMDLLVDIQLEVLSKEVPLLNRMKDKYRRKLNEVTINETMKYELLQRLEGMKNDSKICHGDFNPSNIIVSNDGKHYIIDWAHVTQGNSAGDSAMTYLIFLLEGKNEIAEKYLNVFSNKSGISKSDIQKWIPIVAAIKMEKAKDSEKDLLQKCIDVVEYE